MSLLVVGSMAFDSIRSPFGEVEQIVGGSATYFSIAASCFTPVRLVSVVGRDFPKDVMEKLSARGIDTRGLAVADGETFRWKGYYENDLNVAHTVRTNLNVFEGFDPVLPPEWKDTPYVFLGNINPRLQMNVMDQISKPRIVALDTMNFYIENSLESLREAISKIDVLIINEAEVRQITGELNLVRAARMLMDTGPRRVVIKRGEYGVLNISGGDIFAVPAYPLDKVFDPTGAGDSFAGGFMGYLASLDRKEISNKDYRMATVYGSAVASFTVEAFGTQRLESLSREDIAERVSMIRALIEIP